MDVICCNCDFVYWPTVLRLQLKSDPAKSGSGRILGVGYPNPVSGGKSISVHPYIIHIWITQNRQEAVLYRTADSGSAVDLLEKMWEIDNVYFVEYRCGIIPFWLMLYTRLASPIAVCIAIQGRYTWLAWLANPNSNPSTVICGDFEHWGDFEHFGKKFLDVSLLICVCFLQLVSWVSGI